MSGDRPESDKKITVSRDSIEQAWRRDLEFARKTIRERGALTPMMIVYGRDGTILPIVTIWRSDGDKEASYRLVNLACIAFDAVMLSIMAETWYLRNPTSMTDRPSLSSRREEAIVVTTIGRLADDGAEAKNMGMDIIRRDAKGKVAALEPLELPPEAEFELVATAGLLPAERPSGEERRAARARFEQAMKRTKRGKSPFP